MMYSVLGSKSIGSCILKDEPSYVAFTVIVSIIHLVLSFFDLW